MPEWQVDIKQNFILLLNSYKLNKNSKISTAVML